MSDSKFQLLRLLDKTVFNPGDVFTSLGKDEHLMVMKKDSRGPLSSLSLDNILCEVRTPDSLSDKNLALVIEHIGVSPHTGLGPEFVVYDVSPAGGGQYWYVTKAVYVLQEKGAPCPA